MNNHCEQPFHHFTVRTNGDYNVCCVHDTPSQHVMNIADADHESWMASEYVQQVRDNFQQGKQTPGCWRCWKREGMGYESQRTRTINEYKILSINNNQTLWNVEIDIGNLCNLKCLMCNEKYSSSLLAENKKLGINQISQKDLDWPESSYENLAKIFDARPRVINIRGGEPLYNKKLLQIIKDLPVDQTQDCLLHITTNATVWNDEWKSALEKFRLVRFMFSIDGTEDLYEYIRFPGKWIEVENNMRQIKNMSNSKCLVNAVGQNLNISRIGHLVEWCKQNNLYLQIDRLLGPEHLVITNLPDAQKETAKKHLAGLIKKSNPSHIQNFLVQSLSELEKSQFDESAWQNFVNLVSMRDRLRGNTYRDFIKE